MDFIVIAHKYRGVILMVSTKLYFFQELYVTFYKFSNLYKERSKSKLLTQYEKKEFCICH